MVEPITDSCRKNTRFRSAGGFGAAGGARHHDASSGPQRSQRVVPGGCADRLDDQVDLLRQALARRDGQVRPDRERPRTLVGIARGAEHRVTECLGEHDRRGGDPAAGTLHQHGPRTGEARTGGEHPVGGQPGGRHRRSVLPAHRRRFGHHVAPGDHDLLGERAGVQLGQEGASGVERLVATARVRFADHRVDDHLGAVVEHPCAVAAQDHRQPIGAQTDALERPEVVVVERGGADMDADPAVAVVGFRLVADRQPRQGRLGRLGHAGDGQHLGTAPPGQVRVEPSGGWLGNTRTVHPDAAEPMTWALDRVQIEDRAEPPRTRRTSDLLRLLLTVAVMALVVFAGSIGSGTTDGIQEDITTAVTNVPSLVVSLLATLNSLIVLALPIYVVADLVIRRRWRMLVTALFASSLALVAANLFSRYADEMLDGALLDALTLPTGGGSARTAAAFGVFAGVAALMSAEGQAARSRTRVVVWSALVALGALFLIDRRATPLALLLSVLGGHAIGLVARYVAGTENPRVPARRIVEALARVGVRPIRFRQLEESDLGRRFELETVDGRVGVAQVFDPDRRTSQLISQLTRIVRVRTWVTRSPGWSERAQVQQAAVPILMATANGIRTPELLAAVEVDDRTMAVVEERPQRLRLLSDFPAEAISDEALAQVWREVRRMHHLGIAHEGLHDGSFAVDDDGRVWVLGLDRGEIAAPAAAHATGSRRAADRHGDARRSGTGDHGCGSGHRLGGPREPAGPDAADRVEPGHPSRAGSAPRAALDAA